MFSDWDSVNYSFWMKTSEDSFNHEHYKNILNWRVSSILLLVNQMLSTYDSQVYYKMYFYPCLNVSGWLNLIKMGRIEEE